MVTRRPAGTPEDPCKPTAPSERSLEALQNIFLSPPKFVVGTTASEAAYGVMVGTKGGLSAFWEEAIRTFDGDLEALVRAAAAFEAERKRGRQLHGVRSANGRVSKELHDRVVELEAALKDTVKRWSKAKVMSGLAALLLKRRGEWTYPLYLD
jgi:hypothetical protein